MDEARLRVDFNEMIENNLVLLSKQDTKIDSKGNTIHLKEGLEIKIYEEDFDENNNPDNLIAEGKVELNTYKDKYSWTSACKWNCRINSTGIKNISQLKNGR